MRNVAQTWGRANTRRLVLMALALFAWGVLLGRALYTFGPESVYVQPFNSDSALPVLMANDPKLDAFRTYIYGQDQIGAWPFMLCQLATRATGRVWTDRSIYTFQTVWLFLCTFALVALARCPALTVPALFLLVLCLHPAARHYVFVINQRNAWQVTALLFAWWSLRAVCGGHFDGAARGGARLLLWHLAAWCFALLAAWTSPLSGPALCVFYVLEVARVRACAGAVRLTAARLVKSFAPLAAALLCEQLLKANYHRFALRHFGADYRTPLEFDWGNLSINLRTQLDLLMHSPWWPLPVLGTLAAPFLAFRLARCAARRTRADEDNICQTDVRLDLTVLALGATAVSLVNFATTVIFSWTRLNAYGPRYLALTHLFGSFAGLLTLLLLLSMWPRVHAARRVVFPALATAVVLFTLLRFPHARREPEYDKLRSVAANLSQRAPGGVLLGGYWDTYVFAALEPAARFVPVPAENQLVRTPWTPLTLRTSPRVVVVHHVFPATGAVETPGPYDTFGDGQAPPPFIKQHGATLRLAAPHWFAQDGYTFSLYDNESASAGAGAR